MKNLQRILQKTLILSLLLLSQCKKEDVSQKAQTVKLIKIERGSVIVKTAGFTTDFFSIPDGELICETSLPFVASTDTGEIQMVIDGKVIKQGSTVTRE